MLIGGIMAALGFVTLVLLDQEFIQKGALPLTAVFMVISIFSIIVGLGFVIVLTFSRPRE